MATPIFVNKKFFDYLIFMKIMKIIMPRKFEAIIVLYVSCDWSCDFV